MTKTLPPPVRDKLVKILDRLASPFDGERAAAGLLASSMLQKCGMRWSEVVAPTLVQQSSGEPPAPTASWRIDAQRALNSRSDLTQWETGFLKTLLRQRRISTKQLAILAEIAGKMATQ